jgi:hypothetical protein
MIKKSSPLFTKIFYNSREVRFFWDRGWVKCEQTTSISLSGSWTQTPRESRQSGAYNVQHGLPRQLKLTWRAMNALLVLAMERGILITLSIFNISEGSR